MGSPRYPTAADRGSLLVWLQQTFIRWSKEDDGEKNKEWINGLVKAFEYGLAGKL
jgi:hypothetical protein